MMKQETTSSYYDPFRSFRNVIRRPRLIGCVVLGIAAHLTMLATSWALPTRLLIGWNVATWTYIVLSSFGMRGSTSASIRRRAVLVDQSRLVVLSFSILAAVASIVAIIMQLATIKDIHGSERALHLALSASTILSAWIFIHLVFAFHYAHEFFVERASEAELPLDIRGGLRFPGTSQPIFGDFVYYSFVIGCASQTADVETTSIVMRRITVIHGVLSFFFNTTVLALTINIAAGLI
jgi:uncharacterized membrane protein